MSGKKISLYFHIPFCTRKCDYCHFYVLPDKDPLKIQLLKGLKKEWDQWLPVLSGNELVSIYFGGGTPALMGAQAIAQMIEWCRSSFPCNPEISLEVNPENITKELMREFAQAGINRVSIGIQTLDDTLLKRLGRIHNAEKALEAVWLTSDAGISNISIDLMYDLPGQTLQIWENTLQTATKTPITHLSLYNLTIEPHTLFFKHRLRIQPQLPDEETSAKMYQMAVQQLSENGLHQYEISAFAKNNAFSRHNVGYWTARPFLGLGPSAFSYWEGKRFRNVANLNRYVEALDAGSSPIDFEEQLTPDESRRELLVLRLRLISGVNLTEFQQTHGLLDNATQTTLLKLQENGLLYLQDDILSMTQRGILFYDTIATELI